MLFIIHMLFDRLPTLIAIRQSSGFMQYTTFFTLIVPFDIHFWMLIHIFPSSSLFAVWYRCSAIVYASSLSHILIRINHRDSTENKFFPLTTYGILSATNIFCRWSHLKSNNTVPYTIRNSSWKCELYDHWSRGIYDRIVRSGLWNLKQKRSRLLWTSTRLCWLLWNWWINRNFLLYFYEGKRMTVAF